MNQSKTKFNLSLLTALFLTTSLYGEVDFVKEIQPIFRDRCYDCHGAETREAGLRLDQRGNAFAGSDSGQVIIPENAAESLLFQLVSGEDEDRLMPPDGENLTAAELSLIEKWIDEGAAWPAGVDPTKEQNDHWAYQPLQRSLPADSKLSGQHPIDQFILAQLRNKKIEPSPMADRHTLVKRIYYDLLGLPPTVSEVDQFVNDQSEAAYEKLVDRLLASPHFGERFGRHWLDKARYADSDGYEKDRPRYNAWKYRDWVINAINEDMPFDQFTVEQLAGDLLPNPSADQLLATAFHRQTLTNTEGGTDKEEFRVAAVFDRVETIGSVWLGLTIGCARCHSHKYDQISQREYYELYAFFNNGDEVTTKVPSSEAALQEYRKQKIAYDAELKRLQEPLQKKAEELKPQYDEWLTSLEAKYAEHGFEQQQVALKRVAFLSQTGTLQEQTDVILLSVGDQSPQDVYTLTYSAPNKESFEIAAIRLDLLTDQSLPKNGPGRSSGGNFVLSEIKANLVNAQNELKQLPFASAIADFSQTGFEVFQAIDGKETDKGWAVSPQTGKPHHAVFHFKEPLTAKDLGEQQLLIQLSQQYSANLHTLGKFRVTFLSTEGSELAALPEDVKKALHVETDKRSKAHLETLFKHFATQNEEYAQLTAAVEKHEKRVPFNPEMVVRVIRSRKDSPRQTKVLKRGDFLQPLGPVEPGTLEILPALEASVRTDASRLDFAKWLVNGENPLPPRVFVNQIWTHLFGTGIVETISDFGVRGATPTHPELLDWLATEFIKSGWSRKALIKTIVMSKAYRRSSIHRPELADIDPTNISLYRQNRFRVEAEIVRDLYLAASGLLEKRIGGPSVFPPLPQDVAALSYANNFKWGNSDWNSRPDNPHGVAPKEDIYRRGMYTFFKRTAAHPNLVTFDCPDSNTTCVERGTSNTPLQALQLLNNQVFVNASRAFAEKIVNRPDLTNDEARLQELFRTCVARPPHAEEIVLLSELLSQALQFYAAHPEEAQELSGHSDQEIASKSAAWITVSRAVLNLDEFITRE